MSKHNIHQSGVNVGQIYNRPDVNLAIHHKKNYLASFAVRGRSLSSKQNDLIDDILQRFSILNNLDSIFSKHHCADINLEIGFGDGRHLIERSQSSVNKIFIGCEVYKKGIFYLSKYINDSDVTNIYLYQGDARDLLHIIPNDVLGTIYVLFPDPWHKSKHHKRRILNHDFIELVYSKLRVSGILYFATDCKNYANTVLQILLSKQKKFDILNKSGHCNLNEFSEKELQELLKPKDWIETKYELNAKGARREIFYILASKLLCN